MIKKRKRKKEEAKIKACPNIHLCDATPFSK